MRGFDLPYSGLTIGREFIKSTIYICVCKKILTSSNIILTIPQGCWIIGIIRLWLAAQGLVFDCPCLNYQGHVYVFRRASHVGQACPHAIRAELQLSQYKPGSNLSRTLVNHSEELAIGLVVKKDWVPLIA